MITIHAVQKLRIQFCPLIAVSSSFSSINFKMLQILVCYEYPVNIRDRIAKCFITEFRTLHRFTCKLY